MGKLKRLEKKLNINLPLVYRDFFQMCENKLPKQLIGTDLCNNFDNLKEGAYELIEEDKADIFLNESDFVFMMHQGYMFWYFEVNGDDNPIVYFYREQDMRPTKLTDLKNFLHDYLNEKK